MSLCWFDLISIKVFPLKKTVVRRPVLCRACRLLMSAPADLADLNGREVDPGHFACRVEVPTHTHTWIKGNPARYLESAVNSKFENDEGYLLAKTHSDCVIFITDNKDLNSRTQSFATTITQRMRERRRVFKLRVSGLGGISIACIKELVSRLGEVERVSCDSAHSARYAHSAFVGIKQDRDWDIKDGTELKYQAFGSVCTATVKVLDKHKHEGRLAQACKDFEQDGDEKQPQQNRGQKFGRLHVLKQHINAPQRPEACRDFGRGKCRRNFCRFVHTPANQTNPRRDAAAPDLCDSTLRANSSSSASLVTGSSASASSSSSSSIVSSTGSIVSGSAGNASSWAGSARRAGSSTSSSAGAAANKTPEAKARDSGTAVAADTQQQQAAAAISPPGAAAAAGAGSPGTALEMAENLGVALELDLCRELAHGSPLRSASQGDDWQAGSGSRSSRRRHSNKRRKQNSPGTAATLALHAQGSPLSSPSSSRSSSRSPSGPRSVPRTPTPAWASSRQ